MDTKNLPIGTKLRNKYGNWTIIDITNFTDCKWYHLKGERGHVIAWPSEIGTQYKLGVPVKH